MTEQDKPEGKRLQFKQAIVLFKNAGLSESYFKRLVQKGIIPKLLPEGRKRGAWYPEEEVMAHLPPKIQKIPSTFHKATVEDMPEMAVLLETFYNAKISVPARSAWIKSNPDIAYILRSNNQVIGCAFIMPLSEDKIMQILSNQVKPATHPAEIELYEAGRHYNLYVRAAGVLQSVSRSQRKRWAARLIVGLAASVIELGSKGIYIDRIYAQGDNKPGEKALKMLGFSQIDVNAPTNRRNFMMDIPRSGSPFAMRYKDALNTWRAQNEEE